MFIVGLILAAVPGFTAATTEGNDREQRQIGGQSREENVSDSKPSRSGFTLSLGGGAGAAYRPNFYKLYPDAWDFGGPVSLGVRLGLGGFVSRAVALKLQLSADWTYSGVPLISIAPSAQVWLGERFYVQPGFGLSFIGESSTRPALTAEAGFVLLSSRHHSLGLFAAINWTLPDGARDGWASDLTSQLGIAWLFH